MGLTLVTAPVAYPVSLADAKAHLRVDHTDQDDLIELYVAGETRYAEAFTGRVLVPQTWDYTRDAFPAEGESQTFALPLGRVIEVTGVFYQDEAQVEQELAAASYVVDLSTEPARLALADGATWPTIYAGPGAVRIRIVAGYQDETVSPATADVVEDIKLAILLRVQAMYDGGDDAPKLREVSEIYLRRRRVHLGVA